MFCLQVYIVLLAEIPESLQDMLNLLYEYVVNEVLEISTQKSNILRPFITTYSKSTS